MLPLLHFAFYILTLWVVAGHVNANNFNIQYPADQDVSNCVRNVVKEVIEHDQFVIDVILINMSALDIAKLHGLKARYITRRFSWIHSKLSQRLYVIHCFDIEEFKEGIEQAKNDFYFNTFASFVIIIDNFKDNHHRNIIEFMMSNNLYNVAILAKYQDGFGIYTFQSPLYPCVVQEKLVAVSHCSNYGEGIRIFPKIKDIRGCRFQFLARNFYPLINFDDDGEEGTEQRLLQQFGKYAGVTINLLPASKTNKLGQLVANFTFTEVLTKVSGNDYDGAVGGYFVAIEGLLRLSHSYPLTIDYMMAILPRADYLNTWQALLQKANSVVILVIILCLIFSILAYFLSLFPTERADPIRDILIVFGYFLNKVTINRLKSGIPETLVICSLLFSVFIIPYTLQAYLWSIETHPVRGYEAKELLEVYETHKLAASSVWGNQGLAKHRRDCEFRLECLKFITSRKEEFFFTVLADELFEAYKWWLTDEQCSTRLYKIKEPMLTLMRTVYFRRGSVLVQPYDKFLFQVMSAGLVDRHYKEIVYKEQLRCKPKHMPATVALKLGDLQVSFVLLIGGMCVSTVCFVYELLSCRR